MKTRILVEALLLVMLVGVGLVETIFVHQPMLTCTLPRGQNMTSSFAWDRLYNESSSQVVAQGLNGLKNNYVPSLSSNKDTYRLNIMTPFSTSKEDDHCAFVCRLETNGTKLFGKKINLHILRRQDFISYDPKKLKKKENAKQRYRETRSKLVGSNFRVDINQLTFQYLLRGSKKIDNDTIETIQIQVLEGKKYFAYNKTIPADHQFFEILVEADPFQVTAVHLSLCSKETNLSQQYCQSTIVAKNVGERVKEEPKTRKITERTWKIPVAAQAVTSELESELMVLVPGFAMVLVSFTGSLIFRKECRRPRESAGTRRRHRHRRRARSTAIITMALKREDKEYEEWLERRKLNEGLDYDDDPKHQRWRDSLQQQELTANAQGPILIQIGDVNSNFNE